MTRLHQDFLGPFVECNGAINRPPISTALKLTGKLVAKNIVYTPTVRVIDEAGAQEVWHNCGSAMAYREALKTLPKAEFEDFAAKGCAYEFSRIAVSRALYPQMAKLFPKGLEYGTKQVSDHMALSKSLEAAACKRLNDAYLAKRGGVLPTHPGPAPKLLKVVTMGEVLASMGVAPIPAASPAPARRRNKP